MSPLLTFYVKAYIGARNGKQRLSALLNASQAKGISDSDYNFLCEVAAGF